MTIVNITDLNFAPSKIPWFWTECGCDVWGGEIKHCIERVSKTGMKTPEDVQKASTGAVSYWLAAYTCVHVASSLPALRGIHAIHQLIAACPEGAVQFIFYSHSSGWSAISVQIVPPIIHSYAARRSGNNDSTPTGQLTGGLQYLTYVFLTLQFFLRDRNIHHSQRNHSPIFFA